MKVTKVLSLVLTLALLAIGAVAITASAEETPTVEIASKNLSYDSNISILFAVKTKNTEVAPKLNVYTLTDGELVLEKTVEATFNPTNSLAEVNYANAYIFFTPGIVAKALDKELYVEAVVADGDVEYKSSIERYSVIEYCHEMNAKTSSTDYTDIIKYGARVQKMLKDDGKFEGSLATEYKYVTIDGGTLDGTYNSGIYLPEETVHPQAEDAVFWQASDGSYIKNKDEYIIGNTNVNFNKVSKPVVIDYPEGTYTFEELALGNKRPDGSSSWGQFGMGIDGTYTYTVMNDSVRGTSTKAYWVSPSTTGKDVTLYHTEPDITATSNVLSDSAGATGFEVSFDFKFNSGVASSYTLYIDANNKYIYDIRIATSADGNSITVTNGQNAIAETATVFEGLAAGYNHLAFRVVTKNDALACEIWANGEYVCDFIKQIQAPTGLAAFNRARLRAAALQPIYLDNVYVGFYK